ncbi:MAG: histidine kinase, partial [Bacteroidia bacterium]|nr:histidine kinase [Bacteroidia bacterium]
TYPVLPPGNYVFRVRTSLIPSFANSSETIYRFEILTPVWKRWWFISLAMLILASLIYAYILSQEKRVQQVERLKKEKIEFQFETLKSQVNPHFLFNSFNTLISVIEQKPEVAVEYVEKLSQFFRNIVTYREKDTISLAEEITLADTYIYLQWKRYGDSLKLNMQVPSLATTNYFIPSLSLQLLIENAIKHNAVSHETPLTITISFSNDERLVISNNINEKIEKAPSAGIGLQNIVNRFKYLTQRSVDIEQTREYFRVSLPLLKKS